MTDDSRKIGADEARKNQKAYKGGTNHVTFDRNDILELLKDPNANLRVYLGSPKAFAVAVTDKNTKVNTSVMYRSEAECPPLCIPPEW